MRPQTHLAEVTRHYGRGDAAAEIKSILTRGLYAIREARTAQRVAERGDDLKHNPHISDAGKCLRAVTYSLRNVEQSEPLTEDSLVNFMVGNAVEDVWAQILVASGAEIVREERVSIPAGETVITGRKDFTGTLLNWNNLTAELKSTNSRAMGAMLKKGQRGRDEHRRQLNLYLAAENKDMGLLVYVIKDATRGEPIIYAFEVERDDEQAEADISALTTAYEIARSGKVAPIPDGMSQKAFPCTYCSYKTRCWLEASIEAAQ